MGRVNDKHSYQVKNTFVELVPADSAAEEGYSRSQRANTEGAPAASPEHYPAYAPQTPSPFLQSQPDPYNMPYPMDLLGQGAMQPLTFGSFGVEESYGQMAAFNCPDADGNNMYMTYDPNTGAFMPCDNAYGMGMAYDNNCYGMGMQEPVQMPEVGRSPDDTTQALLSALSDKIDESKIAVSGEVVLDANDGAAAIGNGEELAVTGDMQGWEGCEDWEGSAWGHGGNNGNWDYGSEDQHMSAHQPGRRRAERREAARRQERGAGAFGSESQSQTRSSTVQEAWNQANERQTAITTVMFRNIPNKYTREMLVKQLDEDMRGQFDFVYLPIDFKNKCNVGYAFINFRTVEACEHFVNMFNGMEVRKCLPGLNSRKVTEVTPARVQGFEENVQRLRNSPVMRELLHKPEWMPLIFDHNGEKTDFPHPERSLEPIKPRRRARDDEARNYD